MKINLVIGFDVALVQRAVLSIASKHDQTHQTTQRQDNLLARENYVAGPGRALQCRTHRIRDFAGPQTCVHIKKNNNTAAHGVKWYLHDGLFLSAGAQVSLDLSLVDPIQSQHQEDSPYSQCPEGVALQRVGVQATQIVVRFE